MSHEATNWAIKQRGLKPTTKIVLWHLCDRFNPDYGCFPSQDRLAHDCEISRSTLNDHLGQLETVGLLRRVPRLDPVTKRQLPTRYILGFEPGFTPAAVVPCPEIGHGETAGAESPDGTDASALEDSTDALPCPDFGHGEGARPVSYFPAEPCPENAESRVRNPDTNPVREPLSKPVKEEEGAHTHLDNAPEDDRPVAVDKDEVAHRPARDATPAGRGEGFWQVQFDPGSANFGHGAKALLPVDQCQAVIRRHGPAPGYAQVEPPAVAGRSPP